MMGWSQIAAALLLGFFVAVIAPAQEPTEKEEERPSRPSRYSEPRTANLPPIVSKSDAAPAKEGSPAGPAESPSERIKVGPKLIPSFTPADPRDLKTLLDPTTIIAVVGGYHIITGDLLGDINLSLPPEALTQAEPAELEKIRAAWLQMFLASAIESKLLYIGFMRQERAKEIYSKLEGIVATKFDEQVAEAYVKVIAADSMESREELKKLDPLVRRISEMMVREQLSTMGEADVALAKYGTSLAKERKKYTERQAGIMVLQRKLFPNGGPGPNSKGGGGKEHTREQLLEYYEANLVNFERPARTKWEKLSVKHSEFNAARKAREAIAKMGDDVFLRGASLAAVARKSSQTSDATDGGFHDWTKKGSLRSEVLNKAIFTLPVGELSDILEDDEGLHIVRVIERDDGGYQPFGEEKTQELIRRELREAEMTKIRLEFAAKLRREIAVWNIFDELPEE